MKSESTISKQIQLALTKIGIRVWRNNVGTAWNGTRVIRVKNTVIIENPRIIKFGLCPGSSDFIGFKTVTITPDMVGQRVAVFTGVEVKAKTGRVKQIQHDFKNMVNENGGHAVIARSVDDVLEALK